MQVEADKMIRGVSGILAVCLLIHDRQNCRIFGFAPKGPPCSPTYIVHAS